MTNEQKKQFMSFNRVQRKNNFESWINSLPKRLEMLKEIINEYPEQEDDDDWEKNEAMLEITKEIKHITDKLYTLSRVVISSQGRF